MSFIDELHSYAAPAVEGCKRTYAVPAAKKG